MPKQKEQLALQEENLEELVMKIEMETWIDELSNIRYDKAVEVVNATVKKETHLEDIRLVEESKNGASPERKASKKRNVNMLPND